MSTCDTYTTNIEFFLVPNFSMIAFATAIEPLRIANRMLSKPAYAWKTMSADGTPVQASNGLSISADLSLSEKCIRGPSKDRPNLVLVCSGLKVERYRNLKLFTYLRQMRNHGVGLGGLCTGAWVLAEAGLLDKCKCTIHWENLPGFNEKFPDIVSSSDLFKIDNEIYTCAGGTASFDMMLHIVHENFGDETVKMVCEQCLVDRIRQSDDHQRLPLPIRLGTSNPKLLLIIELMEANIADPLSLSEISNLSGLSRRHIERLFQKYLGRSPARHYLNLRLEYARHLLMQSELPIVEVAIAAGFVSASHFSKCYRMLYKRSPQKDRRNESSPISV